MDSVKAVSPQDDAKHKEKEHLGGVLFLCLKSGSYLSSRAVRPSTFGVRELNFCVRDGNRWILSAIATGMVYITPFGVIYRRVVVKSFPL